jgi:hypothetical protein
MLFALAVITAVAALAALRVPEQYMEPGAPRLLAQFVLVVLALYLGSRVAGYGPPVSGPLTFMQMVVIAILILGVVMRVVLRDRKK